MRMKLLKVVAILVLSGSGDARPQNTEESIRPQAPEVTAEEWKPSPPFSIPRNIREDSRYTWNSGSSRIPYSNYYHDSNTPFIERNGEVSVDESKRSKPIRRSDPESFWNSRKFYNERDSLDSPRNRAFENSGKLDDKVTKDDASRQTLKLLNDGTIRNGNTKPRTALYLQSKVTAPRNVIPIGSNSNVTVLSPKRLDQKSNSEYARDRHPNWRISHHGTPSNSVKGHSLRNSSSDARDKASRRTHENALNNSRSTLVQNSKAGSSDRKSEFFDKSAAKVEPTTPFDHVAAIKKITGMLTSQPKLVAKSPAPESKHSNKNVPSRFPPVSNRPPSFKHPNRTKLRPSNGQASQKKKGQGNKPVANKIHANKRNASAPNLNLKNWPNGAIQNSNDLQNYEKYTSLGEDLTPQETVARPVPLKNSTVNYYVPSNTQNLQEIVNWLKIPAFTTNHSHVVDNDQVGGPISVVFDPVYQNLEPNRPAKPSNVQTLKPDFVYPHDPRPSYVAGGSKVPGWLENLYLKNKTSYNPQTQVSQNTVVHLVNTDPRKPNRTMIPVRVPGGSYKPAVPGPLSPGSLYPLGQGPYSPSILLSQLYPATSSTTTKPGPNVHIAFTSYEEKDKDQQESQTPVVTYDQSCPTILINSFTRINNTVQSKEGCTDLNIIINSHVFNTNVFKSSTPPPLQQDYQAYVETDKYGQPVSGPGYQPQWAQNGYYVPHGVSGNDVLQGNDVPSDVSNVEVFQDTQISISNSQNDVSLDEALLRPPFPIEASEFDETGAPEASLGILEPAPALADSEANADPGLNSLLDGPAATSAPGPGSAVSPSSAAGLISGSTTAASSTSDDDDEYDFSPGGIMESIASVFTYFTFVNPLHYGFFSLAAAPFTALAAGVLGIVTFLFPWVFPSSFNFARANDKVASSFWQNVEEVVRQSMYKYGRLNEWKSKRKKRKR